MTKKHFKMIADAIKNCDHMEYTCDGSKQVALLTKVEIAENFAKALKLENPRFDADKFLTACGL